MRLLPVVNDASYHTDFGKALPWKHFGKALPWEHFGKALPWERRWPNRRSLSAAGSCWTGKFTRLVAFARSALSTPMPTGGRLSVGVAELSQTLSTGSPRRGTMAASTDLSARPDFPAMA